MNDLYITKLTLETKPGDNICVTWNGEHVKIARENGTAGDWRAIDPETGSFAGSKPLETGTSAFLGTLRAACQTKAALTSPTIRGDLDVLARGILYNVLYLRAVLGVLGPAHCKTLEQLVPSDGSFRGEFQNACSSSIVQEAWQKLWKGHPSYSKQSRKHAINVPLLP